MNTAEYFDSRKSSKLIGLEKNFIFFKKLLATEKFPKVLLLTSGQGTGKNTLINHLMNFYFNKKHYGYLFALVSVVKKFFSSIFKIILYTLLFKKDKKKIYIQRFSGIFNSIIGNKSWYRPKIKNN